MADYDIELNENNLNELIPKMIAYLKPFWGKNEIEITKLRGGITNALLACYLKERDIDTNDTILFRIYGKNTEQFICRAEEIETMKLMKKYNLGPAFYAKFANGIAYEYLPGTILDQKMIYDESFYTNLAQAIAAMHFIGFNGLVRESDLASNNEIFIFPEIVKLLDLIKPDYKTNMPNMTDELLKVIPSKEQLTKEYENLKDHLIKYTNEHKSLIVFCHNDLLLGNFIYNKKDDSIKFIDFEYASKNYQAYDVANHFNEFAGVDEPDYSYFPDKSYQLKWLRIYLDTFYKKANEFYKSQPEKHVVVDDEKVNQFYIEVNKFTCASHLMWGIWSLVQAQVSSLEFDFVAYAKIRLDEYFSRKRLFIE